MYLINYYINMYLVNNSNSGIDNELKSKKGSKIIILEDSKSNEAKELSREGMIQRRTQSNTIQSYFAPQGGIDGGKVNFVPGHSGGSLATNGSYASSSSKRDSFDNNNVNNNTNNPNTNNNNNNDMNVSPLPVANSVIVGGAGLSRTTSNAKKDGNSI